MNKAIATIAVSIAAFALAGCGAVTSASTAPGASTPTVPATPTAADLLASGRAGYVAAEAVWEAAQSAAVDAVRAAQAANDQPKLNTAFEQESAAYVAFDSALTSLDLPADLRPDLNALLDANGQFEAAITVAQSGSYLSYTPAQQRVKVALDAIGRALGIPSNFGITTPPPTP